MGICCRVVFEYLKKVEPEVTEQAPPEKAKPLQELIMFMQCNEQLSIVLKYNTSNKVTK
jgi:hypothetical protein